MGSTQLILLQKYFPEAFMVVKGIKFGQYRTEGFYIHLECQFITDSTTNETEIYDDQELEVILCSLKDGLLIKDIVKKYRKTEKEISLGSVV